MTRMIGHKVCERPRNRQPSEPPNWLKINDIQDLEKRKKKMIALLLKDKQRLYRLLGDYDREIEALHHTKDKAVEFNAMPGGSGITIWRDGKRRELEQSVRIN